jgi:hypothetical protein
MSKKPQQGLTLFEFADLQEDLQRPVEECRHIQKEKTRTVWPDEKEYWQGYRVERLTWTCVVCKKVWGRC